ncbi:MAG: cadherin-like domain-containing protein, partial [Kangiellaceae bacterium]|nr:cadherin-like domain-containing protein [Kangiellaceae bacterium]
SSWNRNYIVTTNETDEACRMPLSTDGGYIDFNSEYGFSPSFGGHWNDRVRFNFKDWFPAEDVAFAPYHNTETMPYESINISSQGWVQFDEMPQFWADHYPFAPENIFYGGIPDTMIAPLFRGGMFDGQLGTPYFAPPWWDQSAEPSGVTIAYNDNPKALIIEWDDARTESAMWDPMIGDVVWTEWGDRYDFETYISLEYNFGDNQHEIVMAYDNLQFADENNLPVTPWLMDVQGGSIGLYGFYGPRGTFSPLQGASVTQFAFGDIDRVLHDGLIVCYDYTGPEATQFDITFQLAIDNNATGRTMNVEVVSQVEGIADTTAVHTITSPSNITVGAIADQMTNEDVTLTGVEVIYNDTDPSSNTISASGDNVTVTVNGHESGSTIDITPDENWYGETEITVIVADNSYSNDAHSVSFMLSVVSDGLAAGCTDPTATNYDANAQEDDGSCTLPAPEPAPTPSSSGSGSMNLFLLLLAVFGSAGLRRKK